MSKLLIGSLVGGLILFIWQFLSWGMLNLHGSTLQYTADQDKILNVLADLPEGEYFLPTVPPGSSAEEFQAQRDAMSGKPWAQVSYHKAYDVSFGSNLLRGFIVDFLAVLLLCFVLSKIERLDFKTALFCSLAVGLIGYLSDNYVSQIWFENNSMPELLDAIVQWGLCGLWLGFFMSRK